MIPIFYEKQCYYTKLWKLHPVVKQFRDLGCPLISADEALASDEPVLLGETGFDDPERLKLWQERKAPWACIFHYDVWDIWHFEAAVGRSANVTFCYNLKEGRRLGFKNPKQWARTAPNRLTYPEEVQKIRRACYVGRVDACKSISWVAEVLKRYENSIACIMNRGVSGMPLYKAGIEVVTGASLEEIYKIYLESDFVIYPSRLGARPGRASSTFECVPIEAYYHNCAPVLRDTICAEHFKKYPAQLSSVQHARTLELTDELQRDTLYYMDSHIHTSVRALTEIKALLAEGVSEL